MTDRLSLSQIDLRELAAALDDHDDMSEWWFDPATGQTLPWVASWMEADEDEDEKEGKVFVSPLPSRAAYAAMVEFAESVADPRAGELLARALEGKGAFRRFRNTLDDFPDLRSHWRDYQRLTSEMRALRWLDDEGFVASDEVERAFEERQLQAEAVLAEIGAEESPRFDADDVTSRWPEIAAQLDNGGSVVLTRNDEPWCTITPLGRPKSEPMGPD